MKNGKFDYYYDSNKKNFFEKYYKTNEKLKIHEIIYDTTDSKIPLYLDIEYKLSIVSSNLLDLYLELMKEYILINHNDNLQIGKKTEFKLHFKI